MTSQRSNEHFAWDFTRQVMSMLESGKSLPLVGEGLPEYEVRCAMMRAYPIVGRSPWNAGEINRMSDSLPKVATLTRPYLREVLYALLIRPTACENQGFAWRDYDTLTLAWRCKVGPIHPDDDNDVCRDGYVEWLARGLQEQHPGLDRETARTQAYLLKG